MILIDIDASGPSKVNHQIEIDLLGKKWNQLRAYAALKLKRSESMLIYDPNISHSRSEISNASERAICAMSKIVNTDLNSAIEEIRLVQQGISVDVFESIYVLSVAPFCLHWIIKPSTLAKRKLNSDRLSPMETERWIRVTKIYELAMEVIGDTQRVTAWMEKERTCFDSKSAITIMQFEAGARLVEEILNEMDMGYFA